MSQDNCTCISALHLGHFKSLLEACNSLSLLCSDCEEEKKANNKNEAEVVYICLECLHVGCVAEKKAHARSHANSYVHDSPRHNFAIKPNGELFCYVCSTEVTPVTDSEQEKIAALQKTLRQFFDRINPEEEKEGPEKMIVEELKGSSAPKGDIDKINQQLYQQLIERSKKYPNMCGLSNLGNTCKCII